MDDALKAVEMYDYRLNAPYKLSGGQKQRIAIAGIIAMQPECIRAGRADRRPRPCRTG